MNVRHISIRAALAATVVLLASTASAQQYAPRVSSDDIEGAIMPAIPFPLNDRTTATASRMPQSMGLAPSSDTSSLSSSDESEPAKPVVRRRPFSAQETADRLLAQ